MTSERDIDKLYRSGLIIVGAGLLLEVGERVVGYSYPTTDGLFHIFNDLGVRLNVFKSQEEADQFVKWYWKADGTVAADFVPIKLQ